MTLKQFIEKFVDFIETNNYDVTEGLYAQAWVNNIEPGELTETLLDAGIDPLDHLNYLPWRYLSFSPREKFHIPDEVDTIGTSAFFKSRIKILYVPVSVTKFGDDAFHESMIDTIYYDGTRDQFYEITNNSNIGHYVQVIAKDGTFRYEV